MLYSVFLKFVLYSSPLTFFFPDVLSWLSCRFVWKVWSFTSTAKAGMAADSGIEVASLLVRVGMRCSVSGSDLLVEDMYCHLTIFAL